MNQVSKIFKSQITARMEQKKCMKPYTTVQNCIKTYKTGSKHLFLDNFIRFNTFCYVLIRFHTDSNILIQFSMIRNDFIQFHTVSNILIQFSMIRNDFIQFHTLREKKANAAREPGSGSLGRTADAIQR